jgi:hypothetical protein
VRLRPRHLSRLHLAKLQASLRAAHGLSGWIVCALLFLASADDSQADIYVHPQGSDRNIGSQSSPIATLREAQTRVRSLLESAPQAVAVRIAAGLYELNDPLEFGPQDSGPSSDKPVSFVAVGGEVRISGGLRVPHWRTNSSHWVAGVGDEVDCDEAKVSDYRELWVAGERAIRARTPNSGFYRVEHADPGDRMAFRASSLDVDFLSRLSAAELVFLHDWSISRVGIASVDSRLNRVTVNDRVGAEPAFFSITGFEPHPRYFVENAQEMLDAPGEWFADNAKREVRYVPRPGESPIDAPAYLGKLEQLVVFKRNEAGLVRNIVFDGLTFCHTKMEIPRHGYAGWQACVHERRLTQQDTTLVPVTAAVYLDGVENIRFSFCRFERLGGAGLHASSANGVQLDNCVFRDVGANGIMIGGIVPSDEIFCNGNSVTNCLVEHCGRELFGAVGIWIGFARNNVVQNNIVRFLPYTGISVGWLWNDKPSAIGGNLVHNNQIHDVLQTMCDGGGIYTLGRQPGTRLSDNVIHNIPVNAGSSESNGIFMDEGSSDIQVANNTIYSIGCSPIRFHRAGNNVVTRNRLVTSTEKPAFSFHRTEPSRIFFSDNEEINANSWHTEDDNFTQIQFGPRSRDENVTPKHSN